MIRRRFAVLNLIGLLAVATIAQSGEFNPDLNIGDPSPRWSRLPGVDGKEHSFDDWNARKVLVVAFTCNSCPYAVDYEDRLIDFAKRHGGDDSPVGFVAINVNKVEEDALPAMIERAKEKRYSFAYLYDDSQKIARDFGATRTPEVFVLDADRKIAYMGAIDDDPRAREIKERYLDDAVQAVLDGKQPAKQETVPIGCGIRYERQRRGK